MTEISIPFSPQMDKAAIEGRKSCTSRNKTYGKVGDTFYVEYYRDLNETEIPEPIGEDHIRKQFRLTLVERQCLGYVMKNYYKQEGFDTPEGFKEIWVKLHYRVSWDPTHVVTVHHFEMTA